MIYSLNLETELFFLRSACQKFSANHLKIVFTQLFSITITRRCNLFKMASDSTSLGTYNFKAFVG